MGFIFSSEIDFFTSFIFIQMRDGNFMIVPNRKDLLRFYKIANKRATVETGNFLTTGEWQFSQKGVDFFGFSKN